MKFQGRKFSKASIRLDNNLFYDCIFDSCVLVYRGGTPPKIVNCSFKNTLVGFAEAAANTFLLIANMYHGGFKDSVEIAFNNMAFDIDLNRKKIIFN